MKYLHNAVIKVFAKPEENSDQIKKALLSLVPFNLEDEKIPVSQQTALGFRERNIRIFKITLAKARHTQDFLKHMLNKLTSSDRELLLRQKQSRLDEDLNFFIRLDKPALLDGKWQLTNSGNCFHIKLALATFPKSRERALEIIEKLFKV